MGVVWEAWHTTLGIPVAVKVLCEPETPEEGVRHRDRFRLEAHLAARVNDPHLVRVLDFGEDHSRPYLVMELVQGPTLESWIRKRPWVDQRTALNVAGHICVGLAVLHHYGVVHRDVKPSNVLVEAGQRLKLSDLGLARDPSSSQPLELAGTPQYLAPECLSLDRPFDLRSDLYAVGVILYRMLMGRLPFDGTTEQVLRRQLVEQPAWDLPEGNDVDAGTLYIARRLLEKDPERRLSSAIEVIQACREQVHRMDIRERVRRQAEQAAAEPAREPEPSASASRGLEPLLDRILSASPTWWAFRAVLGVGIAAAGFLLGRELLRP
jgi:serine/threonine-protein kinase